MPTAKKKLSFGYDDKNRRSRKTVYGWSNSTWVVTLDHRFVYDDWNVLAVVDAQSSSVLQSLMWGLDLGDHAQPLADPPIPGRAAGGVGGLLALKDNQSGTSGTYFAAYDGNGNLVALTKAADGSVAAEYEYNPFGETLRATGTASKLNPVKFSTKYEEAESGFYDYGHRYLAPSLGRWVSRDPMEERAGESVYAFVSNDPVNAIDYQGMVTWQKLGDRLVIALEPCEIVRVIGHGNPNGSPAFVFDKRKIKGCLAAAGFVGCYADAINVAIQKDGTVIPGSPTEGIWGGEVSPQNDKEAWQAAIKDTTYGIQVLLAEWKKNPCCKKVTVWQVTFDKNNNNVKKQPLAIDPLP